MWTLDRLGTLTICRLFMSHNIGMVATTVSSTKMSCPEREVEPLVDGISIILMKVRREDCMSGMRPHAINSGRSANFRMVYIWRVQLCVAGVAGGARPE